MNIQISSPVIAHTNIFKSSVFFEVAFKCAIKPKIVLTNIKLTS